MTKKGEYKVRYCRYHQTHMDEFDSLKEARNFVEVAEDEGQIFAIEIIKPNGEKIDLKKEFWESMGESKTKNKDLKSYKNPVIENIEFDISGEEIKKGDIVEVNINGIKAKCEVVILKNKGIGEYTIELKRIKRE